MGPVKHLVASSVLAASSFYFTKNIGCSVMCVASGVLVDLDHIIEYINFCDDYKKKWNWGEFSSGIYFDEKATVKVIFHSWEVAILLWVIGLVFLYNGLKLFILLGVAMGYTLHLILDQIGNNLNAYAYFEIYRCIHGWKQNELISQKGR